MAIIIYVEILRLNGWQIKVHLKMYLFLFVLVVSYSTVTEISVLSAINIFTQLDVDTVCSITVQSVNCSHYYIILTKLCTMLFGCEMDSSNFWIFLFVSSTANEDETSCVLYYVFCSDKRNIPLKLP